MIKLDLNGGPNRCQHIVHKISTEDARIDELSLCQLLGLQLAHENDGDAGNGDLDPGSPFFVVLVL